VLIKKIISKTVSWYNGVQYLFRLQEEIKCAEKVNADNYNSWDASYVPDSFSWKARRGIQLKEYCRKRNMMDEYYILQNKFLLVKKIIGNFLEPGAYKTQNRNRK